MADVSRFYEGILSPDGGLYQPAPGGVYDGIIPSLPNQIETRPVQTYPVDASNWSDPAASRPSYQGTPHMAVQLPAGRPANEVTVPALPAFGTGYQMGYQPPPSERLMPNPGLPSQARDGVAAISAAARPTYQGAPHMAISRQPSQEVTLHFEPSPIAGQNAANSYGKPVKTPSGKVYAPMPEYGPPGVAKPAAKPSGIFGSMMGHPLAGIAAIFGPAAPSRAPAVAALQAQGMSSSQAYATAAALAHAPTNAAERMKANENLYGGFTSSGSSSSSGNGGSLSSGQ